MDKSRPGHHAQRPERLPLIIERPDLAHPANHFRTTRADPASSVIWQD